MSLLILRLLRWDVLLKEPAKLIHHQQLLVKRSMLHAQALKHPKALLLHLSTKFMRKIRMDHVSMENNYSNFIDHGILLITFQDSLVTMFLCMYLVSLKKTSVFAWLKNAIFFKIAVFKRDNSLRIEDYQTESFRRKAISYINFFLMWARNLIPKRNPLNIGD